MNIPKPLYNWIGIGIVLLSISICIILIINNKQAMMIAVNRFSKEHKEMTHEVKANTEATKRLTHGLYSIDELYNMGKKFVRRKDGSRYIKTTVLTDEYYLQEDSPFGENPTNDIEICMSELFLLLKNLQHLLTKYKLDQFKDFAYEMQKTLTAFIDDYKSMKSNKIKIKTK